MTAKHTGSTVSVLGTRVMLAEARARGVDADALLAELGVAGDTLTDAEARLPLALDQKLWARAAVSSHDPAFGLDVAARFDLGAFEALDYAMWASETLSDAFARLVRFHRLIGDDVAVRIEARRARAHLVRQSTYDQPARAECLLAAVLRRGRELTGRPLVAEARFAHPGPADPRAHRAFFGGGVEFGASSTELILDSAALALPVHSARPGLARVLDQHMHDLMERLPAPDSFLSRVEQAIARSLRGAEPSLARTARALHASPRTLQRHLRQLGVTHRELVDRVRRGLAPRLLEARQLSLTEVAYLLGFGDVSGFYRAHRRWTGVAPSERRRRAA